MHGPEVWLAGEMDYSKITTRPASNKARCDLAQGNSAPSLDISFH